MVFTVLWLTVVMYVSFASSLVLHKCNNVKYRMLSMMSSTVTQANGRRSNEYLCLDFDGVICASSSESSTTAIIAAQNYWETKIGLKYNTDEFNKVKETISTLRPIIETGYENMLLARYLLDHLRSNNGVASDETIDYVYKRWSAGLRDDLLHQYNEDKNVLIQAFGTTRDVMIEKDLNNWISLNPVYPFIGKCLGVTGKGSSYKYVDYHIITTKQSRFVKRILDSNNILYPADYKLYDLDNPHGSKINVLKHLMKLYSSSSSSSISSISSSSSGDKSNDSMSMSPIIHFVEDRYETLLSVAKINELKDVKLYLVDWGYNTEQNRASALLHDRIQLITSSDFHDLVSRFAT